MKKNFWLQYLEYIKDNPKGYWFKARPFGWGWVPAKWQGWSVIGIFLALLLLNVWRLERVGYTEEEFALKLLPQTFALIILLIVITWRTGEKPRWMWGFPKKDNKEEERGSVHHE